MNEYEKKACIDCVNLLHASNVLHGDLRAPNFIVQPGYGAVIIDFGQSKILKEDIDSKRQLENEKRTFLRELKLSKLYYLKFFSTNSTIQQASKKIRRDLKNEMKELLSN